MSALSILARASVTLRYASTTVRTAVTIRRCSNRPFVHWMGGLFLLCVVGLVCDCGARGKDLRWSVLTADSFIARFPDPDSIHWVGQTNHFSWQAGYVMFAMEKMWRATNDVRYLDYVKRYVDQQVDEDGNIPGFSPVALDNFLPGYAIVFLYEQTHLEKYRIAAGKVRDGFVNYPRNADGGFWHGDWARHQMWVDGVFMGQMFLARYGSAIGDSAYAFDEVTKQVNVVLSHCLKPNGLLLHGWDESRKATWADKNTGLASEVWSEGLGWFAVLIADLFDYLPRNHPDRDHLLSALRNLCLGLKSVQDENTGMWCQVVDKPRLPDNWNETSGTGMFLYLIRRSMEKGYISRKEFDPVVKKAYEGICRKASINAAGLVDVHDCSSIGIMDDYTMYVSQPKELDTFAGIASFILGTLSIEGLYQ
jgi:rhamnogalacturonyl hydrolase YesR